MVWWHFTSVDDLLKFDSKSTFYWKLNLTYVLTKFHTNQNCIIFLKLNLNQLLILSGPVLDVWFLNAIFTTSLCPTRLFKKYIFVKSLPWFVVLHFLSTSSSLTDVISHSNIVEKLDFDWCNFSHMQLLISNWSKISSLTDEVFDWKLIE